SRMLLFGIECLARPASCFSHGLASSRRAPSLPYQTALTLWLRSAKSRQPSGVPGLTKRKSSHLRAADDCQSAADGAREAAESGRQRARSRISSTRASNSRDSSISLRDPAVSRLASSLDRTVASIVSRRPRKAVDASSMSPCREFIALLHFARRERDWSLSHRRLGAGRSR